MRKEYLSWDDYFMSVGFLTSKRSKDPSSQVGACIVNRKKIIVSIGYNGMPKGCSDDKLPWGKKSSIKIETKYMYVCHAEMNAILNKNSADVEGCTLYVALFPCNECAKIIIQSEIKEVVYYSDKHRDKPETIASKRLFTMAGIPFRQHHQTKKICINFDTLLRTNFNFNMLIKPVDKGTSTGDLQIDVDMPNNIPVPVIERDMNKKRPDYIAWEEYFMALAFLSALRSKDPVSQVGACIVNKSNKIVGIGYNGMPRGCDESKLPWNLDADNRIDTKKMYICHAVMNAIMNKNCPEVSGCTLYVSIFPCNECAKFIIQAGIDQIIFYAGDDCESAEIIAAKRMFHMVGVTYRKYNAALKVFSIDFDSIHWDSTTQLPLTPEADLSNLKL